MKIIDNTKFKTKLILILILPIAGILYFSTTIIIDKIKISAEMSILGELTGLSVNISVLVHETQKERGRTAGFLGADGQAFVQELSDQRKNTDVMIFRYNEFLDHFNRENFDNSLNSLIDEIQNDLDRVHAIRLQVSDLAINTAEAIDFYTSMNEKLLRIISYGAKISTEGEVSSGLFAYVNFLQAKERAGIERAVLSNTFAGDRFGPGMFEKLISLIAMQKAYTDNFLNSATPENLMVYNRFINHDSVIKVEDMRNIAIEKQSAGNFGIDPGYWFDTITAKINQLKSIDDELAAALAEQAWQLRKSSQIMLAFVSLITFITLSLTFLISLYMIRGLLKQLGGEPAEIEQITRQISDGNLFFSYDASREYTGVFKYSLIMIDRLREIISHARTAADQVASASSEIAAGNQDLSIRTENQATALEETSASIEEMNASIRSNAENTLTAKELSGNALERSVKGAESVKSMIDSMNEINASGNRIADIVEVINSIAFQTNLLALNASIEAARAGVQGKGFAVVAVEVRKLAKKSDKAATEIAEIIKISNLKIEEGVSIADEAGEILTEIHKSVKEVNILVEDISAASGEQLLSVDQIDTAITSLDENTQKNAALVEEAAASTQQMSSQAIALNDNMKFFKLD